MPDALPDTALDAILALQLTVAWAGEGRCQPRRLGWWETDLIDPAGGGDFLTRLLPKTHAWAALDAVREAARRLDAQGRRRMADPDLMRTIYFLGFELDEQLDDRLALHKGAARPPAQVLPLPLPLGAEFSRERLVLTLTTPEAPFATVPGGRQLRGRRPSDAPDVMVRRLVGALVPLAAHYPLPFLALQE